MCWDNWLAIWKAINLHTVKPNKSKRDRKAPCPQRKEPLRTSQDAESVTVLSLVDTGLFNLKSNGRHLKGKVTRSDYMKMINLPSTENIKNKIGK